MRLACGDMHHPKPMTPALAKLLLLKIAGGLSSLLLPVDLIGQPSGTPSYPYFQESIPLTEEADLVAFRLRAPDSGETRSLMDRARSNAPALAMDPKSVRSLGAGILMGRPAKGANRSQLQRSLSSSAEVEWTAPVYRPPAGNYWVATNQIIVRVKADAPGAVETLRAKDKRFLAHSPLPNTTDQFLLTLAPGLAGEAALEICHQLNSSGQFLWAAPNAVQTWTRQSTNDPLLSRQWHLRNLGGDLNGNPGQNGVAGADAKVIDAWALQPGGSTNVVVAVLDDGPQYNHPDLAPNVFVNTGEIAGNNRDDDNNGYIDDVRGWDFSVGLPGDNNPTADDFQDRHGTAVTGIIAARGNNSEGVAGAAYNVRWFASRMFKGDEATDDATIATAINYASGRPGPTGTGWRGADITNNSWGGGSPSAPMTEALAWGATNGRNGRGVLHVFSSGNGGTGLPGYPGRLAADLPNVLCVGASTDQDLRASYSQYGLGLDLLAPSLGGTYSIVSTDRSGSEGYDSGDYTGIDGTSSGFGGTSASAPLAAGVAALALSQSPTLTAIELRNLLRYTTDRIGGSAALYDKTFPATSGTPARPGTDTFYGFGRINALKALRGISSPRIGVYLYGTPIPRSGSVSTTVFNGETTDIPVHIRNESLQSVTISSPTVSGTVLTLLDASTVVLQPGEIRPLLLRITPTTRGTGSASVNFSSTATGAATYPFTLNWTVVQGAVKGRVVEDFDNDLVADPDEPGLADRLVYLDRNNNGVRDPGPYFASTGVPTDIPNFDENGVFIDVSVDEPGVIYQPSVRFSINHPNLNELIINLHAPDGTIVRLVDKRGGAGVNFTNTELRDLALTPVAQGRAPFTGVFRPESPLSVLEGKPRSGTWKLQVIDRFGGTNAPIGVVTAFSIELAGGEPSVLSGQDGVYRISEAPTGTYRLRTNTTTNWIRVSPASPAYYSLNIANLNTSFQDRNFLERKLGRLQGVVFDDQNGDGLRTSGEPALSGYRVFADLNGNGTPDLFDAGRIDGVSGLPLNIPDIGVRFLNLPVTEPRQVEKIRVIISNLNHTNPSELALWLVHPDGTRVLLFDGIGVVSSGFRDLILDDAAPTSARDLEFIETNFITGTYAPFEPLSAMIGKAASGTWRLEVEDYLSGDTGRLNGWGVFIETREPEATTDSLGRYSIDSLGATAADLKVLLPDGWSQVSPVTPYTFTHNPLDLAAVRDFALTSVITPPENFGIRSITTTAGRPTLDVIGVPLRPNRIQVRANLLEGDWQDAATVTPGASGLFTWEDPADLPPGTNRFYRVVSP